MVEENKEDNKKVRFFQKIKVEWVVLIIFLCILIKFASVFNAGLFIHESPYQIVAGDMFVFTAYGDAFKEINDINKRPPYMAAGYDDMPIFFSPLPGILTAQLSDFTNAETYDIIMHYNLFFIIASILIIYSLLRKINVYIALLSLPVSLLIFKWPFTYYMNWGMHLSNVNFFFVAVSLVAFLYLKKRWMFLIFGLINGAGFLSHGREFQTINIAFVLFFMLHIVKKKFNIKTIDWKYIKSYLFSLIISFMTIFRYWPILKDYGASARRFAGLDAGGLAAYFSYCPMPEISRYHAVYLSHYGFFKWFLIAGLLLLLIVIILQKKDNKALWVAGLYSLIFVVSSFFCIYGNKTTQIRHLSPLFVMPLLGISIFIILNTVKNKTYKKWFSTIITIIVIVLLIATLIQFSPEPSPEYPVSNPYTWEAMKWARDTVDKEKTFLVFTGDNHYQDTLFYLMQHIFYMTDKEPRQKEDFTKKIGSGNLTANHLISAHLTHHHYKRDSFFELRILEPSEGGFPEPELGRTFHGSICDYDYFYTNKISKDSGRQKYAQEVINTLIGEAGYTRVFENKLVIILKNNYKSCFQERQI